MKYRTLELHCQICTSNLVGSVALPIESPDITEDQYREKAGIVDQRCSECEATHGTFKELTEQFEKEARATPAEAEAFVKTYKSRPDFDLALPSEKTRREQLDKEKDAKNRDIIQ